MDIGRFLSEQFGDADGVIGLLAKHDLGMPTRPAVEKWFARQSLTGFWLGQLLFALEKDNGHPISIAPYNGGHDVFG